jgi:hypothetical protein
MRRPRYAATCVISIGLLEAACSKTAGGSAAYLENERGGVAEFSDVIWINSHSGQRQYPF